MNNDKIFMSDDVNCVSEGFEKALGTLEFDKILDMLCDCAPIEGAKTLAKKVRPSVTATVIKKSMSETTEAKRLVYMKGAPSFGGIKDITNALDRAEKDASLNMAELLDVADVLRTVSSVSSYFGGSITEESPLYEYSQRLTPNKFLCEAITTAIISEDAVADNATPELYEIRRKMKAAGNRARESLKKYVSGGESSKYLQDNIITMRNGRFVIPVKQEYRNEIKGLVHDTSSSGATLFVEPMSVVEANNELRMLESKEKAEIDRILFNLTTEVSRFADSIRAGYETLCDIALAFAKAELSFRMDGAEPIISDSQVIDLKSARHPLLDKNKVVPINVSVGEKYSLLIITGPNTGGKTVTLKTLGLFSLMAQSGLHIPAETGSKVPIFDCILADIGDEQSIEQSLSTFSAHMVNIVDIMQRVTPKALVLFDELGAGTDPIEGAALAEAILEKIRRIGCLCAATTHYAELKAYALDTEGVSNASCEFSLETLKPTYKLTIGLPGRSNAFAIAERLGISGDIIGSAKGYVSGESRRFEQILTELENTRSVLEDEKSAVKRLRAELEISRAEAREQRERLNKRLEETERKAEREAQKMVDSARASAEYIFAELDRAKRAKDKEDFAKTLEEAKQNVTQGLRSANKTLGAKSVRAEDEDYKSPRPFKVGDEVIISGINKNGTILAIDGESVTVQAGIIKMKTKLKELRLAEDFPEKKEKKPKVKSYATASASPSATIRAEIDLRGMMCDDAWMKVDKYIDEAVMANLPQITIIHGKGTGALRNYITQSLRRDKRVASFRPGTFGEGDSGVTVVTLK